MSNQIKSVEKVKISDGNYTGFYSGYVVTIDSLNHYEIKVDKGIRGFSECSINVLDGQALIETI